MAKDRCEYFRRWHIAHRDSVRARQRDWQRRKYGRRPLCQPTTDELAFIRERLAAGDSLRAIERSSGWSRALVALIRDGRRHAMPPA